MEIPWLVAILTAVALWIFTYTAVAVATHELLKDHERQYQQLIKIHKAQTHIMAALHQQELRDELHAQLDIPLEDL